MPEPSGPPVERPIPRCACGRFGYSGFAYIADHRGGWHTVERCETCGSGGPG